MPETPPTPVLITEEHTDGWKLEELCDQLTKEMRSKTVKLCDLTVSTRPEAKRVMHNNLLIKQHLSMIRSLQMQSLAELRRLFPKDE